MLKGKSGEWGASLSSVVHITPLSWSDPRRPWSSCSSCSLWRMRNIIISGVKVVIITMKLKMYCCINDALLHHGLTETWPNGLKKTTNITSLIWPQPTQHCIKLLAYLLHLLFEVFNLLVRTLYVFWIDVRSAQL